MVEYIGSSVVSLRVPAMAALGCVLALVAIQLGKTPAEAPVGGSGEEIGLAEDFGSMPLAFEPSTGRYGPSVDFLSNSAAGSVAVGRDGILLSQAYGSKQDLRTAAVRLALPGATIDRDAAQGIDRLPGTVNDLRGAASQHVTGIPTFERVGYERIWPGIGLELHGRTGAPEYDFRLAPGADPGLISMRVAEADGLHLSATGDLVIREGDARFRQRAPIAFQPGPDGRTAVDSRFALDGRTVTFDLGSYDRQRPLVIDPVTVSYSTYLGGPNIDAATGIAVDASGAAYVTGIAQDGFDTTAGAFDGTFGGSLDVFVSKLNPAGSALVYSTYLGGAGLDSGSDVKVDPSGSAYVSGRTASPDYPTTPGAFQTAFGGQVDAFVTKLNPSGSALAYSTFIGTPNADGGNGIAVDSSGAVYFVGSTDSPSFPVTGGAFQTALDTASDGFVLKLNPTGTALVYSTYLGGDGSDDAPSAIVVDGTGAAYLTGFTNSTDFPTENPIQGDSPDYDGFVSKLNPAGTALVYSTYVGGDGLDNIGAGLAVAGDGTAYVSGYTQSTDYPTVNEIAGDGPGADGVVTRVNPAGTAFEYSTYLSGDAFEWASDVAVDPDGSLWVSGMTASSDFPTLNEIEGDSPGNDGLLLNLGADGDLRFSTYLGGSGDENFPTMALGDDGVYAAGGSDSTDFDTVGEIEGPTAMLDAIVAKFAFDTSPPQTSIDSGPSDGVGITDRTPTFGFSADDDAPAFECSLTPAGDPVSFGPCTGPGATHTPPAELEDGDYTFAVRAGDPFGNVDSTPATVDFSVAPVLGQCLGESATIAATGGDDEIVGTSARDVVIGGGGDDILRGKGGHDLLCGRADDDTLIGGGGDDQLQGGVQEEDRGGSDRDVVKGGKGKDDLFGYAGNETLSGGPGGDAIDAGAGNDKLRGQGGPDRLAGGPGRDKLNGGAKRDRCVGGPDRDRRRGCERGA
jgi:Ca2+-binding RTX toxin-like protein